MQVATAAQSPANPGFSITTPKARTQALLFVFYAGDTIAPLVKARNPSWAAGGAIRSKYQTLQHSSGFIGRCRVTPLMQHMVGELQGFVHPEKHETKERFYEVNVQGKTQVVGLPDPDKEENSQLLYTPFYPTYEAGRLTGQNDGVVLMPVSSFEEAERAQNFLFPNWDELEKTNNFPKLIRNLEKYFRSRRDAAETEFESNVADAAIKSCVDLNTWSQEVILEQNARFDQAKTKGWPWSYGSDAIAAFEMTGISRLDQVTQDQGNKLDRLTDVMSTFVEKAAGNLQAPAPTPAPTSAPDGLTAAERAELADLRAFKQQLEAADVEAQKALDSTAKPPVFVYVDSKKAEIVTANWMGKGKVQVKFEDGTKKIVSPEECIAIED